MWKMLIISYMMYEYSDLKYFSDVILIRSVGISILCREWDLQHLVDTGSELDVNILDS